MKLNFLEKKHMFSIKSEMHHTFCLVISSDALWETRAEFPIVYLENKRAWRITISNFNISTKPICFEVAILLNNQRKTDFSQFSNFIFIFLIH